MQLKEVVGLVDINNTKQADKKEPTDMGKRANYSIANKPKYRGKERALFCIYSNQIAIIQLLKLNKTYSSVFYRTL